MCIPHRRPEPLHEGVAEIALIRARKLRYGVAGLIVGAAALVSQSAAAQQIVTLEEALARASRAEPGLAAAAAAIDAARAGVDQASVRPNPALSVEVENALGTGPLSGVDSAETTATYVHTFERGGDRRARTSVAEGALAITRSDAVLRRLDLLRDVQVAYVDAAAAMAQRDLAEELLSIAEEVRASVSQRVNSALDPAVALTRAELELASARAELATARSAEETTLERLASFWDASAADFVVDLEAFYEPGAHAREPTAIDVERSPDLARITAEQSRSDAEVELEIARGVQDLDAGVGVRHFADGGDVALVAEISIPLGIFDRNRGAIASARSDRSRLAYEAASLRRAFLRETVRLERERATAITQIDALRDSIIPQAQRALAQARDAYQRGAFSSLEVIVAQRALHDAREQLVETLANYHRTDATHDRLTARFAAPLPGEE